MNSYIPFRPAALMRDDAANGDGNVLCMGPDKIDPKCLKGRTLGLEFDLTMLKNKDHFNRNPTMFFKQCDLGYNVGPRSLKIKESDLIFNHTPLLMKKNFQSFYSSWEKNYLVAVNLIFMEPMKLI